MFCRGFPEESPSFYENESAEQPQDLKQTEDSFMTLGSIFHDMWDIFVTYYIGQGLLWTGIGYTLLLSAIAVFFGAILGSLLAIGKMSRFRILNFIITAFVEIMRGTPALLQLYIAYFIVPMMLTSLDPTPIACVAIGLTLNSAAYVSEIIRSGINAVDKGQTEAARALGLTSRTTMTKVVLSHQTSSSASS